MKNRNLALIAYAILVYQSEHHLLSKNVIFYAFKSNC